MADSASRKDVLQKLPVAVASMCLGRATGGHKMADKVKACAAAGFQGIELFYECIKLPAQQDVANGIGTFEENLLKYCQEFRDLCDENDLQIIVMQPLKNYEGRISREGHEKKIRKVKRYIQYCKIMGCDIILIPSMFWDDPAVTEGGDRVIQDFQELADLGAAENPPIRFAYEVMAWGGHVDTWQKAWKVIEKVDRPNFGICLDTYHILARVYGDPTIPGCEPPNAMSTLLADCKEMAHTIDVDKIIYVQMSDAVRLDPPLSESHPWYRPEQKPWMQWSRNGRVFPLEPENGGFMPAHEILRTVVFEMGFRGWVSMEMFHASMAEAEEGLPKKQGERAMRSWKRIVEKISEGS
ncbi:xylose isomerase-like protein [Sarocladium strictum]